MSKKETIGSRLRHARTQRVITTPEGEHIISPMTLNALSQASKVGIGTISEIECHTSRIPTVRTLRKLAKALGITINDLVGSE